MDPPFKYCALEFLHLDHLDVGFNLVEKKVILLLYHTYLLLLDMNITYICYTCTYFSR